MCYFNKNKIIKFKILCWLILGKFAVGSIWNQVHQIEQMIMLVIIIKVQLSALQTSM